MVQRREILPNMSVRNEDIRHIFKCTKHELDHLKADVKRHMEMPICGERRDTALLGQSLCDFDPDSAYQSSLWASVSSKNIFGEILSGERWGIMKPGNLEKQIQKAKNKIVHDLNAVARCQRAHERLVSGQRSHVRDDEGTEQISDESDSTPESESGVSIVPAVNNRVLSVSPAPAPSLAQVDNINDHGEITLSRGVSVQNINELDRVSDLYDAPSSSLDRVHSSNGNKKSDFAPTHWGLVHRTEQEFWGQIDERVEAVIEKRLSAYRAEMVDREEALVQRIEAQVVARLLAGLTNGRSE